ncbi:MAG: hypothetical protein ACREFK_03710 [Stellaceae bacterium]
MAVLFDTLKLADRLEAAGMSQEQAHGTAAALASHGFTVAAVPVTPPETAPDSVTAAPGPRAGRTCAHCGGPLTVKRRTGRFCSARCRQAAYRRRGRPG